MKQILSFFLFLYLLILQFFNNKTFIKIWNAPYISIGLDSMLTYFNFTCKKRIQYNVGWCVYYVYLININSILYLIEPYRKYNGGRGAIQTQDPGSCIRHQVPLSLIPCISIQHKTEKKNLRAVVLTDINISYIFLILLFPQQQLFFDTLYK